MSIPQPYNENELLLRLAAGDKNAFSFLFYKHHPTLLTYAQRFLSFEAAQDIISESFIKFWQHRQQFTTEAQAYQWLKITVRNAAFNQLRAQGRYVSMASRQAAELPPDLADERNFYEAEIETALFARMINAIESLPARQQQIIRLFFLDEMDNTAIAHKLGISVQAVKNQKVTALKSLRKLFGPDELLLCYGLLLAARL